MDKGREMAVVNERVLEYCDGRAKLQGRLYYKGTDAHNLPLVLVLPAYRGPRDNEQQHAIKLAEAGYAAFTVDVYGGRDREHSKLWYLIRCGWYQFNFRIYQRRVWAAFDVLREQPEVDATRLGMIGFCAGGAGVLIMLKCMPELKAAAIFHMGPSRLSPPERGSQKAVTLVHHGGQDKVASLEFVKRRIVGRWNRAGTVLRLKQYPKAGHAFTDAGLKQSVQMGHHRDSAEKAWQETLKLFADKLLNAEPVRNQPAVNPAAKKRRFDVALFHGMGLQERYHTQLDLLAFIVSCLIQDPENRKHCLEKARSNYIDINSQKKNLKIQIESQWLSSELKSVYPEGTLTINIFEVYWASIPTGKTVPLKTVAWLIGGFSSILNALKSLVVSSAENNTTGGRHRYQEKIDHLDSSMTDMWRHLTLLIRLAVVTLLLPSLILGFGITMICWLAGITIIVASMTPIGLEFRDWCSSIDVNYLSIGECTAAMLQCPLLSIHSLQFVVSLLVPLVFWFLGLQMVQRVSSISLLTKIQDYKRVTWFSKIINYSMLLVLTLMIGFYSKVILDRAVFALNHTGFFDNVLHSYYIQLIISASLPASVILISLLKLLVIVNITRGGMARILFFITGTVMVYIGVSGMLLASSSQFLLVFVAIMLFSWIWLIRRAGLFFREYLGDVAAFISTSENSSTYDIRSRILESCRADIDFLFGYDLVDNTLRQDDSQEYMEQRKSKVIILAHSLGSVIAYQSICDYFSRLHSRDMQYVLSKQREYWQTSELQARFKLFVTFGSPLDAVTMGFSRSYESKIETELTGEREYMLGSPGAYKKCRWINWWHMGDLVSAKLMIPGGGRSPINKQLPLRMPWIVNHSSYLTSKAVQEDFRREFERLL